MHAFKLTFNARDAWLDRNTTQHKVVDLVRQTLYAGTLTPVFKAPAGVGSLMYGELASFVVTTAVCPDFSE